MGRHKFVTSCSAFPKGQPNSVMVTEPDGIYEGQRLVYPCEQSLLKTSGRSHAIFFGWASWGFSPLTRGSVNDGTLHYKDNIILLAKRKIL